MHKDKPTLHRAFDWTIIDSMKAEQKELARRLASEAVQAARQKILDDLKRNLLNANRRSD
jgi:hypothetical protein